MERSKAARPVADRCVCVAEVTSSGNKMSVWPWRQPTAAARAGSDRACKAALTHERPPGPWKGAQW